MSAGDDFVDRMIGGPTFNRDEQRKRRFNEAAKAAHKAQRKEPLSEDKSRIVAEVSRYLDEIRNQKRITNPSLHMLVGGLIPMQDAARKRQGNVNRCVLRLCQSILDEFGGPPRD